jgi:hypothetical protein
VFFWLHLKNINKKFPTYLNLLLDGKWYVHFIHHLIFQTFPLFTFQKKNSFFWISFNKFFYLQTFFLNFFYSRLFPFLNSMEWKIIFFFVGFCLETIWKRYFLDFFFLKVSGFWIWFLAEKNGDFLGYNREFFMRNSKGNVFYKKITESKSSSSI